MCGRVACRLAAGAPIPGASLPAEFSGRVNAGPGATLPVAVSTRDADPAILLATWGIPLGAGPSLVINARCESAAATPAWARLLKRGGAGRCAALVDGFFEWQTDASGTHKQPYYVTRADGAPLVLAGLVDRSRGGGDADPPPPRFAILTTDNPPELSFLHDRAPAVLEDGAALRAWLAGALAPAALRPTRRALAWHPVTKVRGSVSYQKADAVADTRKAGVAAAFARAAKKGEGTLAPEPKKVKPAARPPPPGKRKPPPTPPAPRARGQASLHAFLTPSPAKRPKQEDQGG